MRRLELFTIISGLVSIITVIAMLLENELLTDIAAPLFWPSNVSCYFQRSQGIPELGDGEWDEAMLIPSRCIFFLETACFDSWGTGEAVLERRHACAVETAAKINPSMNIFLLFLTSRKFTKPSAARVKKLEGYSNVYVRRLRLASHFDDTPLEDWYSRNVRKILSGEDSPRIIYEIARLVTLSKYGGIFLDLGLVLPIALEDLSNFVVEGETKDDWPAALGIDISTALGRNFANFALDEVIRSSETALNTTSIVEKFRGDVSMQRKDDSHEFTFYSSADLISRTTNHTYEHCPRIYGLW